ncbi:MAG: hypothetical protein K2H39_00965, partial [Paramuribaculum sp.]|nr:hypothetical protein [Paramuribaculum sp.]
MRRLVLVILLLIVSVAASVVLLLYYREFVIGNMVSVIAIYLAVKILMLFSKSEKDLGIILEAVKNGDTTIHFNNVSYPGRIGEKLNEISATLHYTKLSIERNQTYFSYLLNQVPSGIFVANSVGKIFTVNKALLNIIRLPALGSVSRIYEIFPQAAETIATLGEGDIASVDIYDKNYAISCSKIKFPDRGELYIYVLTDIDLQLNRREIESWTMSVRTLSHEIMNNVTPIISISNTLSGAEYIKNCSHELKEGLAA